jgi:hypothetical protein
MDAAVDATAALGRIAARQHAPDRARRALCPLASDPRPYVRANALAALGLSGVRCGDGASERHALAGDASEDVRASAASAVRGVQPPSADDARALEACARTDPSGAVAARCRASPVVAAGTQALLVYVVPDGASAPRPGSAFALLMPDGLLHLGMSDRRGALFDPAAPEGMVTLRSPTALQR